MDYIKNYAYSEDFMVDFLVQHKEIRIPLKKLKEIFILGSYYAYKYINGRRYENIVGHFDHREILSYVYFAFTYALKQFRWNSNHNSVLFKNYFFQLIRFYSITEFQVCTHWKTISQYKQLQKDPTNFIALAHDHASQEEINLAKIKLIRRILQDKKPIYLIIIDARLLGKTMPQIALEQNLTTEQVKSCFQYIKKLVRQKYPTSHHLHEAVQ